MRFSFLKYISLSLMLLSSGLNAVEFLLSKEKIPLELRMILKAYNESKDWSEQSKEAQKFKEQLQKISQCWNIDDFNSFLIFTKGIIYNRLLEYQPLKSDLHSLPGERELKNLLELRNSNTQTVLFINFLLDALIIDLSKLLKDPSEEAQKKLIHLASWIFFFDKENGPDFNRLLSPFYMDLIDKLASYCRILRLHLPAASSAFVSDAIFIKETDKQVQWEELLKNANYELSQSATKYEILTAPLTPPEDKDEKDMNNTEENI